MITSNEFRLLNWVNDETLGNSQIIGIERDCVWVGPNYTNIDRSIKNQKWQVHLEDLKPIELTPEILEKAGFTHRSDHRGEGMMMDFRKGENAMIVYLEYEKNGGGWRTSHMSGRAKIPYLHQLQNLYFVLTGSELPIELTQVERSK